MIMTILNEVADYKELASRKLKKFKEPKAYCTSIKCNGKKEHGDGTEKIVSKHAFFCPDCKSALYWNNGDRSY
jgi:hypothetical protein